MMCGWLRLAGRLGTVSCVGRYGWTRGAVHLLCALSALTSPCAQAALSPSDIVGYGDDKLTGRLHGTPPDDVLDEIARVAGVRVVGGAKGANPVVAEFDAVPIAEALHRLLGDQNFTLRFDKRGKLSTIRLHGGPLAANRPTPTPPPAVMPPPSPPSPATLVGLIENHAPLAISGLLSQALGTTSATFRQLFEVATRNEAMPLRSESLRVMMNAIENEPELRTQFTTTLKAIDDATVSQFIRGAAGERAEELMIHAATQARASELRVKASAVLQQLRTQAPGG